MKFSFPLAGRGMQQISRALPSRTSLRSQARRQEREPRRWARAAHRRGKVQGGRRRHGRAGGHGHQDGPWPEPGAVPSPRPPRDDMGPGELWAGLSWEMETHRGAVAQTHQQLSHLKERPIQTTIAQTPGNGEITRCHFLLGSQLADR